MRLSVLSVSSVVNPLPRVLPATGPATSLRKEIADAARPESSFTTEDTERAQNMPGSY
jgi:hypothetical protein